MNTFGRDIKVGEEVILINSEIKEEMKEVKYRIFICEGGSGMKMDIPGGVIYGKWKYNGEKGYIRAEHLDVEATRRLQGKHRMFDGRGGVSRRSRRSRKP